MAFAAVTNKSLRRSKLVAKGGTWEAIAAANASQADVIHIELEGGIAPENRADAIITVRKALTEMNWAKQEAWVRFGHIDEPDTIAHLPYVLAGRPDLVYCAKVKSVEDILKLDSAVSKYEAEIGIEPGFTQIGAVIERVEALHAVDQISAASARMGAIMFGANDMSLDFGYRRTGMPGDSYETLFIRSKMVLAGRLAQIDIIDAAFMNHRDIEGSEEDARFSARLGFTGKTALSTDQIPGIHRAFIPTEKELNWAHSVVQAVADAGEQRATVDGDLVEDADFVKARNLLGRAR